MMKSSKRLLVNDSLFFRDLAIAAINYMTTGFAVMRCHA
jgi:hypothetical protein